MLAYMDMDMVLCSSGIVMNQSRLTINITDGSPLKPWLLWSTEHNFNTDQESLGDLMGS